MNLAGFRLPGLPRMTVSDDVSDELGVLRAMKIVGFHTNEGLHLGVIQGEEVIDLQAVDRNAPYDLGEWLRRDNGDLSPLKDLARRAPASARRPLQGLNYALPVARPGKIICRPTRVPSSPAIRVSTKARGASSSARPRNGTWARTSTAPAPSGPGW